VSKEQSIADRILSGELPRTVLRSVHEVEPELTQHELAMRLEEAIPGHWLVECGWKWRMSKNSPVHDARFDIHVIERLIRGGVALPRDLAYCESEWKRIQPALAAEEAEERSLAMKAVSFDALLDKTRRLPGRPLCVQALWDGDTTGWFIALDVITESDLKLVENPIGILRFGGDIRLFEGSVPPWPEARYAADVGASLAKTIGAEFYFPAPSEPDDSFPTWVQLQD
jgi:hypothetical protein